MNCRKHSMMMIATQMFALISVKNIILGGGRDRACAHARINWGHCGADRIIAIATAALYKEVAAAASRRRRYTHHVVAVAEYKQDYQTPPLQGKRQGNSD